MLGTFIQTYGFWLLLGIAFVFMMRMHGGGGCGMSHDTHTTHNADPRKMTDSSEYPAAPDVPRPTADDAERVSR